MNDLCSLSAEELTLLATAISVEMAKDKSYDELLVMRNLTSLISQTLFTMASQRQCSDKYRKLGGAGGAVLTRGNIECGDKKPSSK